MSLRIALPVIAFLAPALAAWLIHRTPAEASISPTVGQKHRTSAPAQPRSQGPASTAIAGAACDDGALTALGNENRRLTSILGVLEHNRSGYEAQDKGMALSFPEKTPGRFQREGFEATLRRSLDELENPPELVSVDCTECPCIAALKTRGGLVDAYKLSCRLRESEAWKEDYDEPGLQDQTLGICPFIYGDVNAVVPKSCDQDRPDHYVLVSPVWDCKSGGGFSAADYSRNMERQYEAGRLHELWEVENYHRRTTARQRKLVDDLECAGP